MKNKAFYLILAFLIPFGIRAQIGNYEYRREIGQIRDTWHEIEIPDEVFGKVQPDLADLRIYGFTGSGDTVEAPYMLNVHEAKAEFEDRRFRVYRQYWWGDSYYVIFEVLDEGGVNEIRLNFPNKTFDWKIELEGSDNQASWAHIIDDYRVVRVSTEQIDYDRTTVRFPIVRYRYLKVKIPEKALGSGASAITLEKSIFRGRQKNFTEFEYSVTEDKNRQESIVEITLPQPVPLSWIRIPVENQYDFYRNITVEYSAQTTVMGRGWQSVTTGVISSVEDPWFKFGDVIAGKIRVRVKNYDNEPLSFGKPELGGDIYSLTARFTQPGKYFLAYGSPRAHAPVYDLSNFVKNIPDQPQMATLGEELRQTESGAVLKAGEEPAEEKSQPLLESKLWLWGVMGVVILILGFFTLRMMRE
ncbi:MAG: DUF3999 family protein [Bacteroidia bacterium]|nr:DUF3999 family protein [Bacteroidia bacterium]